MNNPVEEAALAHAASAVLEPPQSIVSPSSNIPPRPAALSLGTRIWRAMWMIVGVLATLWIVFSLLRPHEPQAAADVATPKTTVAPLAPVRVIGPGRLHISPDAPLLKQLVVAPIERKKIEFPILTVSGAIIARVTDGSDPIEDRWQFNNVELSTAYGEWLKTKSLIGFAQDQLAKSKELYQAETSYLQENVKRLKPLLDNSSIPERQFRDASAELIKAQIQGQKNIFEAESTLRTAKNTKVNLERTLSQAGIEPLVFGAAVEHMVLVTANVPESRVSVVKEGQSCVVRFYGYLDRSYPAHVEMLSSSVTAERRTLRVLFEVNDEQNVLRPGMFAEVGLGTDPRDAVLIPAESLLHIGQKDYVLVDDGDDEWRAAAVVVGEPHDGIFEVLDGLKQGQRVISSGSILLKPTVAQALQSFSSGATK